MAIDKQTAINILKSQQKKEDFSKLPFETQIDKTILEKYKEGESLAIVIPNSFLKEETNYNDNYLVLYELQAKYADYGWVVSVKLCPYRRGIGSNGDVSNYELILE